MSMLYATLPGTPELEQALHALFTDEHYRAEWFVYSERIDSFLCETEGVKFYR